MNTITKTAFSTLFATFAGLSLLIAPLAQVHAADIIYDNSGWIDTGYYDYAPATYDYNSNWIDTGYYNYAPATYDYNSDWIDTGYYNYAPATYDYNSNWIDTGYYNYAPATYSASAYASASAYSNATTYTAGTYTYGGGGGGCSSNCNPPHYCPSGYSGTYPNCVPPQHYCPSGYTGTYPNCIPPQPAPTCNLWVSPTSIYQGDNVVISWSSTNANSGTITTLGGVAVTGSQTVHPTTSTTYTGTFSGPGGTITCTGSVGVLPHENPVCPSGYSGTYPNCVPPVVYQTPTCWLNVSRTSINYQDGNYYYNNNSNLNNQVTLTWGSTNANYGIINQNIGNVSQSGSRTVYPTTSTTYNATFYGYNGQSTTCSATVSINHINPPIVYNNTPYVTLSAVPYTGLDLGPVGTVVYWSFLVLWCALAAYLIAVKRVQNSIYRGLKGFLFGDSTEVAHTGARVGVIDAITAELDKIIPSTKYYTYAVEKKEEDKTDDFILSQINRKHA